MKLSRLLGGSPERGPVNPPQSEPERSQYLQKRIEELNLGDLESTVIIKKLLLPQDSLVQKFFDSESGFCLGKIAEYQNPLRDTAPQTSGETRRMETEHIMEFARAVTSSTPRPTEDWLDKRAALDAVMTREYLDLFESKVSGLPYDETNFTLKRFIERGEGLRTLVMQSGTEYAVELDSWMQDAIEKVTPRLDRIRQAYIKEEVLRLRRRLTDLKHIREVLVHF